MDHHQEIDKLKSRLHRESGGPIGPSRWPSCKHNRITSEGSSRSDTGERRGKAARQPALRARVGCHCRSVGTAPCEALIS